MTLKNAVAYSYVRFSSMPQEEGDSVRRQMALAASWSERTGIPLDTSLRVDRGLSGYHSANLDIGALGAFVAAVERGDVRPGSYLVVEALDRITRAEEDAALYLILTLTQSGIRVVQLTPRESVYEKGCGVAKLLELVLELSRGHGESARKAGLVGEARKAAREDAQTSKKRINQRHPSWLSVVGGEWVVDPARAGTLRHIFRLAAQGLGCALIAHQLDAEGVATFGRSTRWSKGTVAALLADGRAEGRFQPRGPGRRAEGHVIPDYYPRVIDPILASQAKAAVVTRGARAGRTGATVNLFAGLLRCAESGASLALRTARDSYADRAVLGRNYDPGRPGDVRFCVPYAPFERAVLCRLAEILPASLESADAGQSVDVLTVQLAEARERQAKLVAALARRPSETLEQAAALLDGEVAELVERLDAASRALLTPASHTLSDAQGLIALLASAEDARAERLRLRHCLRKMTQEMLVINVQRGAVKLLAVQIRFAGGRSRDYLVALRKRHGGRGVKPRRAAMGVWSLPRADGAGNALDFRDADDVRAVRRELERCSVAELPLEEYDS